MYRIFWKNIIIIFGLEMEHEAAQRGDCFAFTFLLKII